MNTPSNKVLPLCDTMLRTQTLLSLKKPRCRFNASSNYFYSAFELWQYFFKGNQATKDHHYVFWSDISARKLVTYTFSTWLNSWNTKIVLIVQQLARIVSKQHFVRVRLCMYGICVSPCYVCACLLCFSLRISFACRIRSYSLPVPPCPLCTSHPSAVR